ncbi:hypothetical protein ACFQPG_11450 [Sphingomonas sp. GCM10030256]|uniref:hypothetical protein n=1 Tax=Sphingomonas sp. GCM10030256 TaxID=3273427 RepID=UPI00360DB557
MQFLRTLFWVVIAVFVAIMARNNWSDVTVNLWGNLQADIKLPLLLVIAFLLGFLPPLFVLRAKLWRLRRKLSVQQPIAAANPPAAAPHDEELTA